MGSRMMQGKVKWEVIRVLEGSDFNFRKNLCTRSVAVITSYKTSFVTLLNPPAVATSVLHKSVYFTKSISLEVKRSPFLPHL
jgi:hypothetical protein